MNRLLVTRARRFVWADDQAQKLFVQKHMSTKLEPTPFFPNLSALSTAKRRLDT